MSKEQEKIDSLRPRAEQMFIYFSRLMDRQILDKNGQRIGELYDIIVKPTEIYPQSTGLIVRRGFLNRKYAVLDWQDIEGIAQKRIHLKKAVSEIVFLQTHNSKEELTLRRDILDQQVVDTHNHKVIRVNDIHLLSVDHSLVIAHVDISLRGIFRRLGLEKFVDFLVKLFKEDSLYLTAEHLVSWKHIQPLKINPVSMNIKIDVPGKQLSNIPAADLGEIFLDLNLKQQIALFRSLDLNTRAKIFTNIDFRTQKLIIEELKDKEAVEILNSIPPDEATDFLDKFPKDKVESFLSIMESIQSKKLSQLLGYSNDSAGGLMTTDFLSFPKDTKIESALQQIKERTFKVEPAQFVYIVDEGNHFIGSTNFRRMILTNPVETLEKAAFPKTYCVHLDSGLKEVAYLMEKYKYYAIAVVDRDNVMQGIITVDDILSQMISIAWRRLKKIKVKAQETKT